MLYLHCGWPRTGTKSLQTVLVENRAVLASAGLVYPDSWQGAWGPMDRSHNGLFRLMKEPTFSLAEFRSLLDAHSDSDILISSEAFTILTRRPQKNREAFESFIAAARETIPVTCIWTLRRFDDFLCSFYLWLLSMGNRLPSPVDFVRTVGGGAFFAGMLHVESVVDESVHLKYVPDGGHNLELLRLLGLPAGVANALEGKLKAAPRLNSRLSRKQAATLLNAEPLSARAGAQLEREALKEAFVREGFCFDDDGRCDLVDGSERARIHRRALEAAIERDFAPYVDYFGAEEIAESSPAVDLGPDALSDEDLRRLVAHLRQRTLSAR